MLLWLIVVLGVEKGCFVCDFWWGGRLCSGCVVVDVVGVC